MVAALAREAHLEADCRPDLGPATPAGHRSVAVSAALNTVAPHWPLAVIAVGLLGSAAWTLGLLYGAYSLALWAAS